MQDVSKFSKNFCDAGRNFCDARPVEIFKILVMRDSQNLMKILVIPAGPVKIILVKILLMPGQSKFSQNVHDERPVKI